MKTLDTRDLYKRQQELEDLKQTVETAAEELAEAEQELTEKKGVLAALEETPEDETTDAALEIASEEVADAESAVSDAQTNLDDANIQFGEDEQTELAELDELESEVGREWKHGEQLIPEDYFENHARELADELGYMDNKATSSWPFTCIDWEQAAEELKQDYSQADYQGTTYFFRA